jgi:hypothetical protein
MINKTFEMKIGFEVTCKQAEHLCLLYLSLNPKAFKLETLTIGQVRNMIRMMLSRFGREALLKHVPDEVMVKRQDYLTFLRPFIKEEPNQSY